MITSYGLPRATVPLDGDEPTPAALHRATLAAHQPKRHRPDLPRLVKLLANRHPEHALALLQYGAFRPEQTAAANDNGSVEADADAALVWDMDSTDRTRPSVPEILRAAPSGTYPHYERRACNGDLVEAIDGPPADGETVRARCGDLLFDLTPGRERDPEAGFLLEYGRTSNGSPRRPSYRMTAPKGAAWPERTEAAIRRYLALPGAEAPTSGLRRPFSGAPAICGCYDPLPRSKAANRFGPEAGRAVLKNLGVDGDVEFVDAALAARRVAVQLPAAIVSREFDGIVHGGDDAPTPYPVPADNDPRETVTATQAEIIEEALAGGTLADIGRIIGAARSYAARAGKAALLDAIAQMRGENDNSTMKTFAA